MRRYLIVLLGLCIATSAPAARKMAVFTDPANPSPPFQDDIACATSYFVRSGWAVDYYNAALRTWGSAGISDGQWFSQRYDAALVLGLDGGVSAGVITGSSYGTKFQNAAGTARVSESPLGGRWDIPTFVAAERLAPSATADDTTANNFVCGLPLVGHSSTFNKPSVDTAGTWRYRMRTKLVDPPDDTLYADNQFCACRGPFTGAGTVAALVYHDTTSAIQRCGADTVMQVWRYRPRGDKPGVYYSILRHQYTSGDCAGIFILLQYAATLTQSKPNIVSIPIMEHSPEPVSLTPGRIENFRRLYSKLEQSGIKRTIAVRCSPTPSEVGLHTTETINIIKQSLNSKAANWQPFSNITGWDLQFYTTADTANARKAFNQLISTATNKDTVFSLPYDKMVIKALVTGSGNVGVWMGKMLKDAGVDVIESTINTPQTNWTFQVPANFGRNSSLVPYILPGNDNRVIHVRPTIAFIDGNTLAAVKTAAGYSGAGDAEYIGDSWINPLFNAAANFSSIYWHTGGANGICADDPFAQYLLGTVLARHFRMFNKLITPVYGSDVQIAFPVQ